MMDKILLCEKDYLACFCEISEEDGIITYSDELLKDMYSHNFFGVEASVDKEDVISKLNQKFKEIQEVDHCLVVFDNDYDDEKIDEIAKNTLKKMELTKKGCYVLDTTKIDAWKQRDGCEIYRFTAEKINDVIHKDIETDGEIIVKIFVRAEH